METNLIQEGHNENNDDFSGLICDAYSHVNTEVGHTELPVEFQQNELEQLPTKEAANFYSLLEDAKQKLYPGCDESLTKFSFIVKLLHQKCMNKWTDMSMGSLLEHYKETLSKRALVPDSYYDAKKIINKLGLDYVKIDACLNDCILYRKEHENAQECPVCGLSRWKSDGNESNTNRKRKKVPQKVLCYFPITQRLQRLYMSKKTAKDMRWHKEENVDDGLLKHSADSLAWKSFDTKYPTFASDPRSVRFGLASDGFNPFGNMSSSYSVWPVVLVPYNLSSWLCMKQPYFMMALLIPGKHSPGNDIDVYLQLLIDELKELWEIGVDTYDAYSRKNFKLQAAVLWTINDFPAYGNLLGWMTKGKLACPCCHIDTSYYSLISKGGYMGHRRFLPKNHKWRTDGKSFDGKIERRGPPKPLSGEDVLRQHSKLEPVVFGKGKKRKRDPSNWSKRSVFFQLPYWSSLLLRHNLDVMHIERNVSESLLGTLNLMPDKTKDTLKARYDLVDMGIRSELHPFEVRGVNCIHNE